MTPRQQDATDAGTIAVPGEQRVAAPGQAAALASAAPSVRHLVHLHATRPMPPREGDWCANLITPRLPDGGSAR